MAGLSATHRRHILQGFLAIHRRMAEMEALIAQAARSTSSPFAQFTNDLAPVETQVLRDHFARVRAAMLGHLQSLGIPLEARPVSLRWALQTNLTHLQVALDDFGPESLAGYGAVDDEARRLILAIQEDLGRLLDQTAATVRREVGWNLAERLARLDAGRDAGAVLSTLERILARWRLVEFRPLLDLIVSRLEAPRFEIAVFGRVSSGKSSLLNHITGFDVLPVGVTPVTAVPTRLTPGPAPQAVVSFAEGKPQTISVERLGEFASESENPNNIKHVTDILVQLPSPRLREGVVFVDTPGVGALVRDGAAETWAYLPRCDLGLVLIAAASSLGQEDLMLLRTLAASDIPAMVLLSKADLLTPSDRQRVLAHTREQIQAELGLDLPIDLVSVVGADESLLTNWFEQRVQPLLERHRTLLAASLQRKTEGLKASMLAALEGLARRAERSGQRDAGATLATVRARLDEADALIRSARERAFAWSDDRAYLLPIALERAARQTLANPPSGDGGGNNGNAVVAASSPARRDRREPNSRPCASCGCPGCRFRIWARWPLPRPSKHRGGWPSSRSRRSRPSSAASTGSMAASCGMCSNARIGGFKSGSKM
jgi:GTP-binding protein EngB required for normal cell division